MTSIHEEVSAAYNELVSASNEGTWDVSDCKDVNEELSNLLDREKTARGYFNMAAEHYANAQSQWQNIIWHCDSANQYTALNSRDSAYRSKGKAEENVGIATNLENLIRKFMAGLTEFIDANE